MLSKNGKALANAVMQQFEGESAEDVVNALATVLGRVALTVAERNVVEAVSFISVIAGDTIKGVTAWGEKHGKAPAPDWVDE